MFGLIICSSAATFVNATRIRRLKRSIKTSERGDKKNGGGQRTRRSDKKGLRIGQLGGTGPVNNYRNWVGLGILSVGRAHVGTTRWKTRSNYEYGQRSRSPVPNSGLGKKWNSILSL